MKIHHARLLYCREGHFEVCLTLPNNIERMERVLSSFSVLRVFFVIKFVKHGYFLNFHDKKYAQN